MRAALTPDEEKLYLGERLQLAEARGFIEEMDLSGIRDKLIASEPEGLGWSDAKADFVLQNYRDWLFLRRKHEDEPMPPTFQIDEVWHLHILDTRAYRRHSGSIFGYMLDHNPYFGIGGPEVQRRFEEAGRNTVRRYEEEYGKPLEDWDG